MQCTLHSDAAAATLCARCFRALCSSCAVPRTAGRVCAGGCNHWPPGPRPRTFRRATDVARLGRLGATAFLLGASGAMLHFVALALAAYTVSLVCLSVALQRRVIARRMA
jgi:hypothetical protein